MVSVEHHTLCDGVQLQSIRDTKFKTFRISVHFLMPLAKETAAANALVPFLLTRATRRYPDFTLLSRKMDDLYGAGLGGDVGKIGDCQVLTVTASALANDYALAGEDLVKEMTDVLCEALFDPVLEDGLFREEDLRQEKRQTLEQIDADFADKRVWALQRCMEAMCADEPFGVGRFGSREAVAALTREAVTDAWRTMCRTARVEILVLGDCDPRGVFESLKAAFANVERAYVPFAAAPAAAAPKTVRRAGDTEAVVQGKLVLGMRSPIYGSDPRVPAMRLMAGIFGGTPNGKLFLNVRERMSLCYYCSANYLPPKGFLFVQSGVEFSNMERAESAILDQLAAVQRGNFTEEDVATAKLSLCNSLLTAEDSLSVLDNWYLSQTFGERGLSPTEYAARVNAVGREEILEAANTVQLDTVYRLTGKKEGSL